MSFYTAWQHCQRPTQVLQALTFCSVVLHLCPMTTCGLLSVWVPVVAVPPTSVRSSPQSCLVCCASMLVKTRPLAGDGLPSGLLPQLPAWCISLAVHLPICLGTDAGHVHDICRVLLCKYKWPISCQTLHLVFVVWNHGFPLYSVGFSAFCHHLLCSPCPRSGRWAPLKPAVLF
jgi:hypothetical protein